MLDKLTAVNTIRTTQIESVKTENPTTKTYTFTDKQCAKAKPGQFLMLWIPGIDEIPLSIINTTGYSVSVTVKNVGDATRHLHGMRQGDTIGVRGPFGNHFTPNSSNVLLIAGGTGTAPLLYLAKQLAVTAKRLSFIMGAKTRQELLFLNQLEPLCTEPPTTTRKTAPMDSNALPPNPSNSFWLKRAKRNLTWSTRAAQSA